jgi:hypothetical protein
MLSEKKIACMYRGMIALRKLETHRKCERRMRKKVGADLGADASEMPYIYIYIYRAQVLAQTQKTAQEHKRKITSTYDENIVKQI